MLQLRIVGDGDIRAFGERLKAAADTKELTKQLRKNIRRAAQPAIADVKKTILALPVTSARGGGGSARAFHQRKRKRRVTSLRASIAAGVSVQSRFAGRSAGVRIMIRPTLPPDQKSLPKHLDSASGWRHPVFGDETQWVQQYGRPYFASTLQKYHTAMRQAVLAAIQQTIDKLT